MNPRATSGDARQESRPLRALRKPLPPIPPPVERAARHKTIPLAPPRPDEPRPDEQRGKGSSIEQSPGWIASVLLHAFLLFVLTLIVPVASVGHRTVMVATFSEQESEAEVELVDLSIVEQPEFEVDPIEMPIEIDRLFPDTEPVQAEILDQTIAIKRLIDPMSDSVFRSDSNALMRLPPQAFGSSHATGNHSSMAMIGVSGDAGSDSGVQGELGGRASRRMKFATPEMNYAINNGLNWLARHQLADGGWSFNHQIGECRGRCPDRGNKHNARVAATGLALLPFLGAGHSPLHGEYRETISAGINFLIANTSRNGSLWFSEGRMYGHGIATLALCECYGIMKQTPPSGNENGYSTAPDSPYQQLRNTPPQPMDGEIAFEVKRLEKVCVAAVDFIEKAQASDGGWRYRPGELGDTSVVGWQVMALKSAKEAGLDVSETTVAAAAQFLNSVQRDPLGDSSGVLGTRYAYMPGLSKITPATTAIGHACRICMGASPYHPAIKSTVNEMVDSGHRGGDMYYNFYANQVVFQHGGLQWEAWSQKLNKDLIKLQERRGHLQGSWHFGDGDSGGMAGGRLYATAMSCLCLEENFRHLPTFRINAERRFAERFDAAMTTLPADKGLEARNDEPAGDRQEPKCPRAVRPQTVGD